MLRANATMQEMFGYSEGEALNLALSTLTHPDDVMSDIEAFQDVCAGLLTAIRSRNVTTARMDNYSGAVSPLPRSRTLLVSRIT